MTTRRSFLSSAAAILAAPFVTLRALARVTSEAPPTTIADLIAAYERDGGGFYNTSPGHAAPQPQSARESYGRLALVLSLSGPVCHRDLVYRGGYAAADQFGPGFRGVWVSVFERNRGRFPLASELCVPCHLLTTPPA